MKRQRRLLFIVMAAACTSLALAALPGADVEENRKILRDWQANKPEEYARIRKNYQRFRGLPPAEVERIRKLDSDLYKDALKQERLGRVLEEYSAWLMRLQEGDRARIQSAASREDKLRIIREIKDREWFKQLPRAYHEQYAAAKTEKERQDLIRRWRQQEKEFDDQWADTHLFWSGPPNKRPFFPLGQQAFWKEIFDFVRVKLYPMLDETERDQLEKNIRDFEQGTNPGSAFVLLKTIHDLSERHPVLSLQPKYTNFKSLPPEYQRALERVPKFILRDLSENRWPQYPLGVTMKLRQAKMQPPMQLGPANSRDISDGVDKWVQKELWPRLSESEKSRLRHAEGKWPDYPQALHELAKAHRLAIPEMSLPGDPQVWEFLRRRPMMPPGRKGP